jgi:hypothetical protein
MGDGRQPYLLLRRGRAIDMNRLRGLRAAGAVF